MEKGRKIIAVVLVLATLITGLCLCACSGDADEYVIPEGRELSSLKLYCRSTAQSVTLEGENFTAIEAGLRRIPKLSAAPSDNDVGDNSDARFDYTITVTLKKQGIKPSRAYKVYVGIYVAASVVPSEGERKSVGKAEVHTKGYIGACDAELIDAIELIAKGTN